MQFTANLPVKSVLVCIGGEAPDKNILSEKQFYLKIAVDSGYLVFKRWGIRPDLILGDFDSIPNDEFESLPSDIRKIYLHKDKNYTDTSVCLIYIQRLAQKHQFLPNITIVGGFGSRIDHFIEHIDLFKRPYAPNRMIGSSYQMEHVAQDNIQHISHEKKIYTHYIGDKYISLMPLSEEVRLHTEGLKWNLDSLTLSSQCSSLSNEYVHSQVHVSMHSGRLIVIWLHNDAPQLD